MRLPSVALLLAAASSPLFAAEPAPSREHFAPKGHEAAYHVYHYTPAVKVGNQVIVSGIPAGPGETYEDKVRVMFRNLEATLAAAGATLADVVEINTFHVQATDTKSFQAEFDKFAKIHHEFFPDHYPAWTAVGTTALLAEGAPLEMRVVAVIGSGANPRADIPAPAKRPPPPAQ